MKILKFGGTSVGSAQRIRHVASLIRGQESRIVVLSAMSGTTDALSDIAEMLNKKDISLANSLIDSLESQYRQVIDQLFDSGTGKQKGSELLDAHFDYIRSFTLDMFTVNEEKAILAQGELLSTALFTFHLEEIGVEAVLLPALNFMRIDADGEPDIPYIQTHLKLELDQHPGKELFITQGYICRDSFGEIDNLRRGGSDFTATLIGAALVAEEIQIWTDIDGMHNNDPRFVEGTSPIAELSFDEAAELAYFGAQILHPTCVVPAMKHGIPVRLLNTMQPQAKGTLIGPESKVEGIKAVAAKDNITAINIKSGRMLLAYGFLRSVFEVFERCKTSIDMITTSEVAVSLTIDNTRFLPEITQELATYGMLEVEQDMSIICIVGNFGAETKGYASRVFDALRNIPVRMISHGGSANNISILVRSQHKVEALRALHASLFLKSTAS